jgi:hypothetical protein
MLSAATGRAVSRIRFLHGDELNARYHPEPDPDLKMAEQESECR